MKVHRAVVLGVTALTLVLPVAAAGSTDGSSGVVGARSWRDLENPVLAASDRGGHLLVARRPLAGRDRHGAVMAASLGPGRSTWSPLTRLSSQSLTVGLDADIAGAGAGLVAWTSGGHVFARNRGARGVWGPQVQLSRQSGTRWVGVDVNRAGDQAVTWYQDGRVYLAWRAAGGTWHRWLGPVSYHLPVVGISERRDGQARARVTWLDGLPGSVSTAIRIREYPVVGPATQGVERALVAQPRIRDFAWAAGPTRTTLAVVHDSDPYDFEEALQRTTTTYAGAVLGPLTEQWSQRSSSSPRVSMVGSTARVTWKRLNLSGNLIDVTTDVLSRLAHGTTWTAPENYVGGEGPGIGFDDLVQDIDADGHGLLGFRVSEYPDSGRRDSLRITRFRDREKLYAGVVPLTGEPSDYANLAPVAVGVSGSGPLVAAWSYGGNLHPVVAVRGYPR